MVNTFLTNFNRGVDNMKMAKDYEYTTTISNIILYKISSDDYT